MYGIGYFPSEKRTPVVRHTYTPTNLSIECGVVISNRERQEVTKLVTYVRMCMYGIVN